MSKTKKLNSCSTDNSEAAIRYFSNTHRKTLAPESTHNKFIGPQACNFIKKRHQKSGTTACYTAPIRLGLPSTHSLDLDNFSHVPEAYKQ